MPIRLFESPHAHRVAALQHQELELRGEAEQETFLLFFEAGFLGRGLWIVGATVVVVDWGRSLGTASAAARVNHQPFFGPAPLLPIRQ